MKILKDLKLGVIVVKPKQNIAVGIPLEEASKPQRYISEFILRQEAIKHIKNCDNTENFTTNNMCGFYYDEEKKVKKSKPVFCDVCNWIIYYFNLTEEELK